MYNMGVFGGAKGYPASFIAFWIISVYFLFLFFNVTFWGKEQQKKKENTYFSQYVLIFLQIFLVHSNNKKGNEG